MTSASPSSSSLSPSSSSSSFSSPPSSLSSFSDVSEKVSFSDEELKVLSYWKSISAFKTQMELSKDKPIYNFYDGPPFATGLPHYGHILAGTIKDTVTRYACQTGHSVPRNAGWDCHGLPVEYEVDQKLGIKSKDDVMKMGVAAYNAECRSIVLRYTGEWRTTVERIGRWIDFENEYKTMDTPFMESVWWVISQIHEKGLLYRGYKVMPYSTACTTPLSNFEAGLNYKDVKDPAVVVSFPTLKDKSVSFLAWTTTPWTLPSNLALAVNPKMEYVKVKDNKSGNFYILMKSRLEEIYSKPKVNKEGNVEESSEYKIIETMEGSKLANIEYEPLFNYFASHRQSHGAFRVLLADYVTADSGTGVVHQAPAFGEDDYSVCSANNVVKKGESVVCPVDDSGRFTDEVKEFSGRYVKDADKDIIKYLKEKGRMIKVSQIDHAYPHCWRSDSPLIYKAVPSWFINVEAIKEKLLANNEKTYWVPSHVKEGRFHNWLRDAHDWAISRNRYWGTPLPIWQSDDGKEIVVVSSVKQLEELTGQKGITDIHKDKIDHLTIKGKTGILRRVPEVADCWLESGSMPYAQLHYPFENKERFENTFPADFIAEGLDQTRGWFYTLMVISTAIFDKPPWKNLIVNGLVLAQDGKKMSKRLKNYPDPLEVVGKYGADALRVYLISSPVVRAETLKFSEIGVWECVKAVFLPWYHGYRFFVENSQRYEIVNGTKFTAEWTLKIISTNVMDKWILASLQTLIKFVREEMAAYRLYTVLPRLLTFIEHLTNWYIKMNRKRLKGSGGHVDCLTALSTLYFVFLSLCRLMAPFTPFLAEMMYQNLKGALPAAQQLGSIHFQEIPTVDESLINAEIEKIVSRMQATVELNRSCRMVRNFAAAKPLRSLLIISQDKQYIEDLKSMQKYLLEESNVFSIEFSAEEDKFVNLRAEAEQKALGQRLKGKAKDVISGIAALTTPQIKEVRKTGKITVAGEVVTIDEMKIILQYVGDEVNNEACGNSEVIVVLNCKIDEEIVQVGHAKEVIRTVQKLRKTAGLVGTDDIDVFYTMLEKKSNSNEEKKAEKKVEKEKKEDPKEKAKAEREAKAAAKEKAKGEKKDGGDDKDKGKGKDKEKEKEKEKEKKKEILVQPTFSVSVPSALAAQSTFIRESIGRNVFPSTLRPLVCFSLAGEEIEIDGQFVYVEITTPSLILQKDLITAMANDQKVPNASQWVESLQKWLGSRNLQSLKAKSPKTMDVELDGVKVTLIHGKHYFFSMTDFENKGK